MEIVYIKQNRRKSGLNQKSELEETPMRIKKQTSKEIVQKTNFIFIERLM
jgi:hypothetical protein